MAQGLSDEWFTKNEIARRVFATTPQNFDKTYRPAAPTTAEQKVGREVYFHARGIIDALVEQAKRQQRPQGGEGDPLLADGDSPGLERYRNAKADLAEMERDRQRKQIVRVSEVEPALLQLAGVLRNASENLARQFGNEAAGIVNEAVDEWADGVAKLFADSTADGGDEGTAAADDEAVRGTGADPADGAARGAAVPG